jgi:hypothetical protein
MVCICLIGHTNTPSHQATDTKTSEGQSVVGCSSAELSNFVDRSQNLGKICQLLCKRIFLRKVEIFLPSHMALHPSKTLSKKVSN